MKERRSRRKVITGLLVWSGALYFAVFVGGSFIAKTAKPGFRSDSAVNEFDRKSATDRIIGVLERKMKGRPLPEKTKGKLSTLSDEKIRLMASLSAQMTKEDQKVAGDIAFLLIAVLIVLP